VPARAEKIYAPHIQRINRPCSPARNTSIQYFFLLNMEERMQKTRREEGEEEREEEESIALRNTNQESAEAILGMIHKVANKLRKTIADNVRTMKSIKINVNYDI